MKRQILNSFWALIALLSFGAFAAAQENNSPNALQNERQHKRGFGRHHRGGEARALAQLNLSETQKQQVRALVESQDGQTKTIREELKQIHDQKRQNGGLSTEQETRAQALRAQLDAASQKMRADLATILTAEQRAQLEQMRGQGFGGKMRGFKGGFGGKRGGMMRGGFGNLNLTEAQQQQARTIFETARNNTENLRGELKQLKTQRRQGALSAEQQNRFNELRSQLRDSMKKTQEQFQAILTPEQRQQIEQQREQRRSRFENRRSRQNGEPTPQQ